MFGLLTLISILRFCSSQHVVSRYAGQIDSSSFSGDNGPATSATFANPLDMYMDSSNNLFVTDLNGNRVYKVSATGLLTNFAGDGSSVSGGDSLAATSAGVHGPADVVVDTLGDVYISEFWAHRIRKVTSGYISSFCGTTSQGNVDGYGTGAQFFNPRGMGMAPTGDEFFIADYGNALVRKIVLSNAQVTTFAGSGTVGTATSTVSGYASSFDLLNTWDVWLDSANVFVAASGIIYKIEIVSNIISRYAGTGTPGAATVGVAATSSNLSDIYSIVGDKSSNIFIGGSFTGILMISSSSDVISNFVSDSGGVSGYSDGFSAISSVRGLAMRSDGAFYFVTRKAIWTLTLSPTASPTWRPSQEPSRRPSAAPLAVATSRPTEQPSRQPTQQPTILPTSQPSPKPSTQPSSEPSGQPSCKPSEQPSCQPSGIPSVQPSRQPSSLPSSQPTSRPSCWPSSQPSSQPVSEPTCSPSSKPTSQPSLRPSSDPSAQPSVEPTVQPSGKPTGQSSASPTSQPTVRPTRQPTSSPSSCPSRCPSSLPSSQPSNHPSCHPTCQPILQPSAYPSLRPSTISSASPSGQPTHKPSSLPTIQPTRQPSSQPSSQPTSQPWRRPTGQPSAQPTLNPLAHPTSIPSSQPFAMLSVNPSSSPTIQPLSQPSRMPSSQPSSMPSLQPSGQPSASPSRLPFSSSTCQPTARPSCSPRSHPSTFPSSLPSSQPSAAPTVSPSRQPSTQPSTSPSKQPLSHPSCQPTSDPTAVPSCQPSDQPTVIPTQCPTSQPSSHPTSQPVSTPSAQPTSSPSMLSSAMRISTATLSADGSYCDFLFSSAVHDEYLRGIFPCSHVIHVNQSPRATCDVQCVWRSSTKLRALLHRDEDVCIDTSSMVSLRNGSRVFENVSASDVQLDRFVAVRLSSEAKRPVPSLRSIVSSINGRVIGMYMDSSEAIGSNGGPWRSVRVESANGNYSKLAVALQKGLQDFASGSFWIDSWYLRSSDVSLRSFNVTVCSVVGLCGSSLLTLPTLPFINATEIQPIAQIRASGSELQFYCNESVVIYGDAFVPANKSHLQRDWSREGLLNISWSFESVKQGVLEASHLSSVSANPSVFRLPGYSLTPGREYQLALVVKDAFSGVIVRSRNVLIACRQSSLVALLRPAQSSVTLGVGESVQIDASQSFDPDAKNASLSFTWICSLLQNAVWNQSKCLLTVGRLVSHAQRVTVSAANATVVGTTHRLQVQVRDIKSPHRNASMASIDIHVALNGNPSVFVWSTFASLRDAKPSAGVNISASVYLPAASARVVTSCHWTLLPKSSTETLALHLNASQSVVRSTATSTVEQVPLMIRSGWLLPAARYTFSLSCSGVASFVKVLVTTNLAPFGGFFRASPSSGVALHTYFSLASPGWQDDNNPLTYMFEFSVLSAGPWVALQSRSPRDVLEFLWLPAGANAQNRTIHLRLTVYDALDAMNNCSSGVQVKPAQWTTEGVGVERQTLALIGNVSQASSYIVGNVISAIYWSMRSGSLSFPMADQRNVMKGMLVSLRKALLTSDVDDAPVMTALIDTISTDYTNVSLVLARSVVLPTPSSGSGGSLQSQLAQTQELLSYLAQTLLDLSDASASGSDVLQLAMSDSLFSIALTYLTRHVNNQSLLNASVISFLPTVRLPNSQNTLSVADNPSLAGNVLVTALQYDLKSLLASSSNQSGSGGDLLKSLLSDVISLRVQYTGNLSSPVVPIFAIDFQVPASNASATLNTPIFQHNCSLGQPEHVSFLCVDSNVRMNLTCTGLAAAEVRRKCPVPRRVCNVLNLQTESVVNEDYCVAVQSSATSITCQCGFATGLANTSASYATGITGAGGSVSVAVMTEYVASDFVGTISISTGVTAGAVAGDSMAVFVVFGSCWTVALVIIGLRLFSAHEEPTQKRSSSASKVANSPAEEEEFGNVMLQLQQKMMTYFTACLPHVYHAEPWWSRLWVELCRRHNYLNLVMTSISPDPHATQHQDHHNRSNHDINNSYTSRQMRRQHQRQLALELAQLLTALTLSCFILALLYDSQYPNDDGSCGGHITKTACLQRTSVLDPAQTYCTWTEEDSSLALSAGFIDDYRAGIKLQTVQLESALVEQDDGTQESHCHYQQVSMSIEVTAEVAVIVSWFSILALRILAMLFEVLAAKSLQEEKIKAQARQALQWQTESLQQPLATDIREGNLSPIVPMPPVIESGRGRRRRAVMPSALLDAGATNREASEALKDTLPDTANDQPLETASDVKIVPPLSSGSATHAVAVQEERTLLMMTGLTIPEEIVFSRKRFVSLWQVAHQHVQTNRRTSLHFQQQRQHRHSSLNASQLSSSSPSSSTALSGSPLAHLRHATDAEFGVAVLHSFLVHGMHRAQQTSRGLLAARLFARTVEKDFSGRGVASAVSRRSKWLAGITIALCNLGALFFILLKGIQRGGAWQYSFLYACLLQWLFDEILLQTLEVLWIDFALPGLVFTAVHLYGMAPLLLKANLSLRWSIDHPQAPTSSSSLLSASFPDVIPAMTSAVPVYRALALDRDLLPESQLLLQQRPAQDLPDQPRQHDQRGPASVASSWGFVDMCCSGLAYLCLLCSLETQRLCFRAGVALLMGGLLVAWASLRRSLKQLWPQLFTSPLYRALFTAVPILLVAVAILFGLWLAVSHQRLPLSSVAAATVTSAVSHPAADSDGSRDKTASDAQIVGAWTPSSVSLRRLEETDEAEEGEEKVREEVQGSSASSESQGEDEEEMEVERSFRSNCMTSFGSLSLSSPSQRSSSPSSFSLSSSSNN